MAGTLDTTNTELGAAIAAYVAALPNPAVARPVSGQYTTPLRGSTGTITPGQNTLWLSQLQIAAPCTLSSIGVEVTALTAASTVRLGIYSDAGGLPGTLLLDAGNVATTSVGAAEAAISQAVPAGAIWLAMVRQSAAGATIRAANSIALPIYTRNSLTVVTAFNLQAFSLGSITGALPSTVSGYIGDATPPVVAVKFA